MNAIHFLHALVVVIFLLCMKTSSSESESLFKNGKMMMIRCIAKEKKALLLFKQGVTNKHDDFLESWKKEEEEDCCVWEGVVCDNHTSHVTQLHLSSLVSSIFSPNSTSFNIGSSLLDLPYLDYLDLSYNYLAEIPEFIGSLTKLVHLNLSHTSIGGSIPYQIGNLSNLHYLDLYNSLIISSIPKSIGSLNSLTYLDLSNTFIGGSIPYQIGNLSNLHYLDLHNSFINSSIPKSIGSLKSLIYLDLSNNLFSGVIPQELGNLSNLHHLYLGYNSFVYGPGNFEWLFSLSSSLTSVDLSTININAPLSIIWSNLIQRLPSMSAIYIARCNLTGSIPESFGNMTSLTHLDLSANQLNGVLPQFIFNLSNLEAIDFSDNYFTGPLPDLTQLSSLTDLDLSNNHLSGSLPDFTGFSSLEELRLYNNSFSGSIPDFTRCSSLKVLKLHDNQLTEWKTQSIGLLSSLTKLDVSMNSIHSTISEAHLSNLSSLEYLHTSFNPLKFELNSEWLPPFQLSILSLASCKLGPKFPNWIRNQSNLDYLDISNTQISDTIPLWFWNISVGMQLLNLSSNKIRGKFSPKYDDIVVLDLSSNYFDGPLPAIPACSLKINLSQNKFSGTLFPLSVGEDVSLRFLDISHNQLVGAIPDYWMHFQYLLFLNFGYNNLTGSIPKSIGHLDFLYTLILRNNKFYGELPISLRNCKSLGFVDFGLNKLSGKVPSWIGEDLPNLYSLILKSNSFYDRVPRELCHLSNLHFLDLSMNKISGTIPPCFKNLTAMIQKQTQVTNLSIGIPGPSSSYYDNVLASWKGHELEYGRNFAFLKMIDLSTNELTGEIPIEITRLVDLKGLNLSGNRFYGNIPSEIGRLKELESLDLSTNQFSGEIPASMTRLYFLSYLDLSNNNLKGRIPSGTQLQGFNISTYEGNTGLCGKPLTTICPGDDEPNNPSSIEEENGDDITEYDRWFYISAVLGFSTTFWGIIGTLILNRRWRHAYFIFLNNLKERLYVAMAVRIHC